MSAIKSKMLKFSLISLILGLLGLGFVGLTNAEKLTSTEKSKNIALVLNISGAIGPATQDYVSRSLEYAAKERAKVVILKLNTPGGLETAMRGITQAILASPVPVISFVAPQGARAASAGTYIVYASPVAAMAPGTNIGAATPVQIGKFSSSETDKKSSAVQSTEEKKATEDAAAYLRSLASVTGRNSEWAESSVKTSVSLSAEEALKLKVIDLIAKDIPDLLNKINGKTIKNQGQTINLETANLSVEEINPDWRFEFLSIISDPTIAYILLLIGIFGIYFEFSNPGFVLPGAVGGIALLLALYAFQVLPINYTGFGLLLLGILFMIIEVYVSSFGVLGIGGIIAFVVGSILLFDRHVPGYSVAWQAITLMTLLSAGFFLILINLMFGALRKNIVTGREALIGEMGQVLEANDQSLFVQVLGEIWQATSQYSLHAGQRVRIVKVSGLLLTVEPLSEDASARSKK